MVRAKSEASGTQDTLMDSTQARQPMAVCVPPFDRRLACYYKKIAMLSFFRSKKYWIISGVILLGGGIALSAFSSKDMPEGIEIAPVSTADVVETISETGSIEPIKDVALAFEFGGRVEDIPAEKGMLVQEGDVLVQLDSIKQSADLTAAYARFEMEQVRLQELLEGADQASLAVSESGVEAAQVAYENAKRTLDETTAQHNQLVENARTTLRSSDLQAYLTNSEHSASDASYAAPTITGTYESEEDGAYIVELYRSNTPSGYSFRATGLETFTGSVSTAREIPLGTRGLYIQFPEDFAKGTAWEIPIPNTRAATYLTHLNAYTAALNARDVAIASAESTLKAAEASLEQVQLQYDQSASSARNEQIQAQRAVVRQTEAAVATAEAAYNNTVIRAPFNGVVTELDIQKGELVAAGAPVVSLISEDNFEITVNISESDIKEITVDDTATVTLDAYDDEVFEAYVVSVAPHANIVDGVRVFEVKLRFTQKHDLIRSGLSADIDILAEVHTDVLAIPSRAIAEDSEGKFVRSYAHGSLERIPVTVGLRGSNGLTEITGGLQEGQMIVTFADSDALQALEQQP